MKDAGFVPVAGEFNGCSAVHMAPTLPNKSFICMDYFMLIVLILEPESILYMNKKELIFFWQLFNMLQVSQR